MLLFFQSSESREERHGLECQTQPLPSCVTLAVQFISLDHVLKINTNCWYHKAIVRTEGFFTDLPNMAPNSQRELNTVFTALSLPLLLWNQANHNPSEPEICPLNLGDYSCYMSTTKIYGKTSSGSLVSIGFLPSMWQVQEAVLVTEKKCKLAQEWRPNFHYFYHECGVSLSTGYVDICDSSLSF